MTQIHRIINSLKNDGADKTYISTHITENSLNEKWLYYKDHLFVSYNLRVSYIVFDVRK